jgi:hypothetical protein
MPEIIVFFQKHLNKKKCTYVLYKLIQFLKVIEHANARLTIKEATEPPTFGR